MFYTRIFTIFYVNFLQTLRIIVKQDCIFTNKKIVSASANCSQQHDVVTAHAINLQESWRFHRILPGSNLVPRACDPWEGNEGSGIIRIRHTENCMSIELRMRWQKQNKLFEIFYCFVYKMIIFSGFWWKC